MKDLKTSRSHFAGRRRMRLLLGTLTALVVSDGLISKFLVAHGLAYEGNPFLQVWVGEDMFLLLKIVAAFLTALILWDMYKHHPRLSFISTLCFVMLYTVLVFWSLFVCFITQV